MKRKISLFLVFVMLTFALPFQIYASDTVEELPTATAPVLNINAKSAILMEAETGKILYEQNASEALPPASVTKIMTLLMVMEAIESGKITESDMVTVSEYAASMGGSQVFLASGEKFTVRDLLKCTVISSANDAAVALAEHLFGSEMACVEAMNKRAKELGLQSTCFENVTGLDDTTANHVLSAQDIATITRKLITYPLILEFSSTWIDTIREGEFTLNNTNRLIKFYPGATGLKTGSTSKAKFCLAATAQRNGMTLIAVIMGADTRDIRNSEAMRMLDFGFANFTLYRATQLSTNNMYITKGEKDNISYSAEPFLSVVEKGKKDKITYEITLPDALSAPVAREEQIGFVTYSLDGVVIGTSKILASETVNAITFGKMLKKMLQTFLHPN